MTYRLLIAAVSAAICLSFVGVAQAEPFPTVADAIVIADQAWPGSPCHGQLTVVEDPALAAEGIDGRTEDDGSCEVKIASDLGDDPAHRCDIIVHEGGHRAGLDHALTGIMRATPEPWASCHSTLPAITYRIQKSLPGRGWRVACPATADELMTCRATNRSAKPRRFTVRMFGPGDFSVRRVQRGPVLSLG